MSHADQVSKLPKGFKIIASSKNSNFSEVKDLTKKFKIICSTLCDKTKSINERLKNIEAKDESKQ